MFIDKNGNLYAGDMQFGDRVATEEEVSAWESKRSKLAIQEEINSLESASMLPRVSREFMLSVMEREGADAGYTKDQLYAANIGYRKLKDLDTQIRTLRKQL